MHGHPLRVAMPCAVMASKEFAVSPPTLEGWRRAQRQTIEHWDENDLALQHSEIGLKASPTKVVSTEVISSNKDTQWITDGIGLAAAINKCV